MKSLLLAPALLLSLGATVAHADDTFRRTLTTGAEPDLYVSTGSGTIRVVAGTENSIEIVGHVHAGWGASGDVRSRVARIVSTPPIAQNGNTVRVGEAPERGLLNNISIDYELRVPKNVALNLHSGSGDVEINGAGRFVAAGSGSGSVRAHQVHGPAELESGSGDIELEETTAGNVKARSGSGSIRVHGLNGSLNARTGSGDIETDGHLEGPSALASGSGSIRLHLGQQSHFNLEAATGSGNIRVHMPGFDEQNNEHNRHHLTAPVNGGGAPLAVRTGSGDIEVTP